MRNPFYSDMSPISIVSNLYILSISKNSRSLNSQYDLRIEAL